MHQSRTQHSKPIQFHEGYADALINYIKKINDCFFKKSEELCQLVGGANSPVWDLFEEVMDEYHKIELILSKAMYLKGAEDREKMLK